MHDMMECILQLKGTLMAWVQATNQGEGSQLPAYLRNKIAQIIVQIVRVSAPVALCKAWLYRH